MQPTFTPIRRDSRNTVTSIWTWKTLPAHSHVTPGTGRGGYCHCLYARSPQRGPEGATCPFQHRIRQRGPPQYRSAKGGGSRHGPSDHTSITGRSLHSGPHRPWLPHSLYWHPPSLPLPTGSDFLPFSLWHFLLHLPVSYYRCYSDSDLPRLARDTIFSSVLVGEPE